MATLSPLEGLGIYVHFPWCLTKCPYCDFHSVAVRGEDSNQPLTASEARERLPHREYADAIINELRVRREDLGELPPIRSVFFGGGTPSLWAPGELGRVMRHIASEFWLNEPLGQLEVTVECNPTSFDSDHGRALVDQGVTRVSLGVQGLDSDRLTFLGRLHDPAGALDAVRQAIAARVPRVSADLIYGVYKQSPRDAVSDVERVVETGVDHLSAYALTIEPGTRFGALAAGGKLPLLDDAQVADSFEAVSLTLGKLGFRHYEISNFSRPNKESQHNLGYWWGRDYLGVGSGAYGTVSKSPSERLRYRNLLSPEKYVDTWTSPTLPSRPFAEALTEREELSPAVSLQEALLLGLRTEDGIDLDQFRQLRGAVVLSPDQQRSLDRLVEGGRLTQTGARLRIPREHWLFADAIIRDLI